MTLFAFSAAGAVTILAVVLIVAALVVYLARIVLDLRRVADGLSDLVAGVGEMVRASAPVNGVVTTINEHLDAGVDVLEGLLVKKAGLQDAVGIVEGLYPGAGAAGLRRFPASSSTWPAYIGDVYARGAVTLAQLNREAEDEAARLAAEEAARAEAEAAAAEEAARAEAEAAAAEEAARAQADGGAAEEAEPADGEIAPAHQAPDPAPADTPPSAPGVIRWRRGYSSEKASGSE